MGIKSLFYRSVALIIRNHVTPERIISEIEKLSADSDKVEIMSVSAKGLHLEDTNQRILAVVEELLKK